MEFVEKYNRMLALRRMSASELGRRAGISNSNVIRWTKGAGRSPRLEDLQKIARALEVSVGYLVDDAIEDPADVGDPRMMGPMERSLMENGRALGVEDAAMVLKIVRRLGIDAAVSRLIGQSGGAVEGGQIVEHDRPTVGGRNDHGRDERPEADQPVAKPLPRHRAR